MTIKEMKNILKEMKDVCNFEDSKTFIEVNSTRQCSPFDEPTQDTGGNVFVITQINDIDIRMQKSVKR